MRNAGLNEAQAGIKIAWGNINNLRYADDATLMAETKENSLLKVKGESEKVGLKLTQLSHKAKQVGTFTVSVKWWGTDC